MSFPCLEGQLVAAILITAALGTLSHQIAPGALSEALKIENKRKTTTTTPLFIQTVYNHRFGRYRPSTFSHCCNCPLKQEVLFLGTPCRSMNALDGGAFCCGSGVGFPISFGRCCSETGSPRRENSANKRFDITGFRAAHLPNIDLKKRPKPSIDGQGHQKGKDNYGSYADEQPNSVFQLKPNDGLIHRKPWVPYMHRPFHRLHAWAPHLTPYDLHMLSRLQPTYWDFQGYFPEFMRKKIPWAMNPFDSRSIHFYPEYQFGNVQFMQFDHPFLSRPQFSDKNGLLSEWEQFDREEGLTHSKNRTNNQINNHFPEDDRKVVNHSEDLNEGLNSNQANQSVFAKKIQGNNVSLETNQYVLNLNPLANEDEAKNYPEYSSESNTGYLWSSSEKKQGEFANLVGQLDSSKTQKENAIFKDLKKGYLGFDLDDISMSYAKRKELNKDRRNGKEQPSVISSLGAGY